MNNYFGIRVVEYNFWANFIFVNELIFVFLEIVELDFEDLEVNG